MSMTLKGGQSFLTIALVIFVIGSAGSPSLASGFSDVEARNTDQEVGVGGAVGRQEAGGSATSDVNSAGPGSGHPNVDYYYALLDGSDGPCVGWTSNPAQALSFDSAGQIFALYDMCPAAEGEEVDPVAVARLAVLRFWAGEPVPAMALRIRPGRAITGLPAFLETGPDSATKATLYVDTPVGTGQLDIKAAFVVDWGDGSAPASYHVIGGPWPDGEIHHVYQDDQPASVRVMQTWTGSWRIVDGMAAGHGGALPPLTMEALLDLPVTQVQAVIQ